MGGWLSLNLFTYYRTPPQKKINPDTLGMRFRYGLWFICVNNICLESLCSLCCKDFLSHPTDYAIYN